MLQYHRASEAFCSSTNQLSNQTTIMKVFLFLVLVLVVLVSMTTGTAIHGSDLHLVAENPRFKRDATTPQKEEGKTAPKGCCG